MLVDKIWEIFQNTSYKEANTVNYERFFVAMRERVINDLGDSFSADILDELTLSLSHQKAPHYRSTDEYRSRPAKVPAYYNPNTHTIHLNIDVLDSADDQLVENIYYHELVHASSHHARMTFDGQKILKSGLKVQVWDEDENQVTLHRGLNEGITQYLANSFTAGGPAYKSEVAIIGKLISKIGMKPLKEAYFGSAIDQLETHVAARFGAGTFQRLSQLVDAREYEAAAALIS